MSFYRKYVYSKITLCNFNSKTKSDIFSDKYTDKGQVKSGHNLEKSVSGFQTLPPLVWRKKIWRKIYFVVKPLKKVWIGGGEVLSALF